MTSSLTAPLSCVVYVDGETVSGYVLDPADPTRHFVVELLLDGWTYGVARADAYDHRSPLASEVAHCHGFAFALPRTITFAEVEVRLANVGRSLAKPTRLGQASDGLQAALAPGRVQWDGGLVVSGYVVAEPDRDVRIRGLIDEVLVFEVAPLKWASVRSGSARTVLPRFEAHVPLRFATGTIHRLEVVTTDGAALVGSPLHILAFDDGLERHLMVHAGLRLERLRGRWFDKLMPQSMPFAWIDEWVARFPIRAGRSTTEETVAVVCFGEAGVETTVAGLEACRTPWLLGVLPWHHDQRVFDAGDLVDFLESEAGDCETIVFTFGGTLLHAEALAHFAAVLANKSSAFAFADIILEDDAGVRTPIAFSGVDIERMLEQGCGIHLFAMTRDAALAAARGGAVDPFGLWAAGLCADMTQRPRHLSGFLATCRSAPIRSAGDALRDASVAYLAKHGFKAIAKKREGSLLPLVHVQRVSAAERVSVLIPAHDQPDALRATVESLRSVRSRHGLDLHVIDMGSSDESMVRYLSTLEGQNQRVVRTKEAFNVSRVLNEAAKKVRSRLMCFLEAGCTFQTPGWLEELVSRCVAADVAAVGPELLSPSRVVQAAGLVLGPRFSVAPAFAGCPADDPGPADLLLAARSCSALPLPGLFVKRKDFVAVGGFDERLGRIFHSVDLCLALAAREMRVIVSPHAHVTIPEHMDLAARLSDPSNRIGGIAELDRLRAKWNDMLANDPHYGASLAASDRPYTALAWPPRGGSLHDGHASRSTEGG